MLALELQPLALEPLDCLTGVTLVRCNVAALPLLTACCLGTSPALRRIPGRVSDQAGHRL